MNTTTKTTFHVTREIQHGYVIDTLHIAEQHELSTNERVEGAVDNKDGYGTAEAAEQMGRVFRALRADGHEGYYDWTCSGRTFSVRYQVYANPNDERPEYCAPSFDFPRTLSACRWAMKFFDKIGRRLERERAKERTAKYGYEVEARSPTDQTFQSLQDVVAALKKAGAVEVRPWSSSAGGSFTRTFLVPRGAVDARIDSASEASEAKVA